MQDLTSINNKEKQCTKRISNLAKRGPTVATGQAILLTKTECMKGLCYHV